VHNENDLLFPAVEELAAGRLEEAMPESDGGEAACSAHLFGDGRADVRTRDDVQRFVVAFYRDVAMDDLLGPIFAAAHVDWSAHIPKLVDFWAWQLLGQPGYERNPLRAHEPVHTRTPFTKATTSGGSSCSMPRSTSCTPDRRRRWPSGALAVWPRRCVACSRANGPLAPAPSRSCGPRRAAGPPTR
jgi:hypothetical protein